LYRRDTGRNETTTTVVNTVDIHLWVGADMIKIRAGFSEEISVAAILGRRAFFENFTITFDLSSSPPGFEIQRLGRA